MIVELYHGSNSSHIIIIIFCYLSNAYNLFVNVTHITKDVKLHNNYYVYGAGLPSFYTIAVNVLFY